MAKQYYYLVSSLPDLVFEHDAKGFDLLSLKEYVQENVSRKDFEKVETLFLPVDNENILNSVLHTNAPFIIAGKFDEKTIEKRESPEFPSYIVDFFKKVNPDEDDDNTDDDDNRPFNPEHYFLESFYAYTQKSGNKFIRNWFLFDQRLRNIQAAYAARYLKLPVEENLVGNDSIVKQLATSSASDFGLKNEEEYYSRLFQALETTDLLERERKIDALRWWYINELTTFEYFSLDVVLAFMAKAQLVHRWMLLDEETGNAMFSQLVSDLKESYDVDKAFNS